MDTQTLTNYVFIGTFSLIFIFIVLFIATLLLQQIRNILMLLLKNELNANIPQTEQLHLRSKARGSH